MNIKEQRRTAEQEKARIQSGLITSVWSLPEVIEGGKLTPEILKQLKSEVDFISHLISRVEVSA